MYPPAPSVPVLGPDCINRTVYDMQLPTGCPLYDEQHRFLGRKGPFSFRPTASSSGAIELVRDGSSRLSCHRQVRPQWWLCLLLR